jgi:hypothetical protein
LIALLTIFSGLWLTKTNEQFVFFLLIINLFGMVIGYFDDSGTDANNSVVVVAGYVGSVSQWQKFNEEWGALLSEFGVAKMRRADLESFYGDFVGWTPDMRKTFLGRLQPVIKDEHILRSVLL